MGNRIFSGIIALSAAILAGAPRARAGTQFMVKGYWKWTENPAGDYERHIRISGDSGFYCVLDGKSSFAFDIGPDSLTTPMNGKNAVVWMPNSGDLVISGAEKGVPYTDRFSHSDSLAYWNKCRDEERAWKTTAIRIGKGSGMGAGAGPRSAISPRGGPRGLFDWKQKAYTAAGRSRP